MKKDRKFLFWIHSRLSFSSLISFVLFSGDAPIVAARDAAGLKYKMTDDFSVDTFKAFLTALDAGEIEPYIKSGKKQPLCPLSQVYKQGCGSGCFGSCSNPL